MKYCYKQPVAWAVVSLTCWAHRTIQRRALRPTVRLGKVVTLDGSRVDGEGQRISLVGRLSGHGGYAVTYPRDEPLTGLRFSRNYSVYVTVRGKTEYKLSRRWVISTSVMTSNHCLTCQHNWSFSVHPSHLSRSVRILRSRVVQSFPKRPPLC